MKWERACDCSTVASARRETTGTWPEPDFVIRYESGHAHAFNRNRDNLAADRAQRVPFAGVWDYDDWAPVKPKSAVDMLAGLT